MRTNGDVKCPFVRLLKRHLVTTGLSLGMHDIASAILWQEAVVLGD